ncbi:unnamed protein product [Cunninghamella blakesleeana]
MVGQIKRKKERTIKGGRRLNLFGVPPKRTNSRTVAKPQYLVVTKTTQLLTVPCSLHIVCMRFSRPSWSNHYHEEYLIATFPLLLGNPLDYGSPPAETGVLVLKCTHDDPNISIVSSMDSNLEAFSYYPADGSFAALAGQPAANTNYLNEGFLSY